MLIARFLFSQKAEFYKKVRCFVNTLYKAAARSFSPPSAATVPFCITIILEVGTNIL